MNPLKEMYLQRILTFKAFTISQY